MLQERQCESRDSDITRLEAQCHDHVVKMEAISDERQSLASQLRELSRRQRKVSCDWLSLTIYQGRLYVGAGGNSSPNIGLAPTKCDMKHCLTNSKHRHIGTKRSVCFWQWLCPTPRWELTTLPRLPSRLGSGHRFSHFRRSPIRGIAPRYFYLEACRNVLTFETTE